MSFNGPCVGDVLRPAKRVGAIFGSAKIVTKQNVAERSGARGARRAPKCLRTVVRRYFEYFVSNRYLLYASIAANIFSYPLFIKILPINTPTIIVPRELNVYINLS
jgi:hypothetical protein